MEPLTTAAAYADDNGNAIETPVSYDKNIKITFRGTNNRLVIAPDVRLNKLVVNFDCNNAVVTIGSNSKVPPSSWTIRVGEDAAVAIGEQVSTTNTCTVCASEGASVTIGKDVMFATANQVRADDAHAIFDVKSGRRLNRSESIVIGDHVWLAYGACVLAGSHIGDGSVIGFGSLVTGRIPNNCVAVGSPARVVRKHTAWERPHLSLRKPYYKLDASTVKKSAYWSMTAEPVVSVRRGLRWFRRGR